MSVKSSSAATHKMPAPATDAQLPSPAPVKPLKPRPLLFGVLAAIVALWIALLLTIYFTTVLPARHSTPRGPSADHLPRP